MPDFENLKPKSCMKRKTESKEPKFTPFALSTDARGVQKQIKFEE